MAVGTVHRGRSGPQTPASGAVTIAALWSGAHWHTLATANGGGSADTELMGVSCSSTAACTAVGLTRGKAAARTEPFVERWDGLHWSVQHTPRIGAGFLNAVSCAAANGCTAVGGRGSAPDNEKAALIERWNGVRWRVQRLPAIPRQAVSETLTGVACPAADTCTAVGAAFDRGQGSQVVALGGHGTVWTSQLRRRRGFNGDFLNSVSCVSTQACFAVGGGGEGSSSWGTSARWAATGWSRIKQSGNPNVLNGVSCTSAAACTAVGGPVGLAEGGFAGRWNGSRWSSVEKVSSFLNVELDADSCMSMKRCIAVGFLERDTNRELPLVAVRS